MTTTIAGLPAHALLVHAIVVLAPLTALLEILCALLPAARRRFVWLVLVLAVVTTALTPLTIQAGSWLYQQQAQPSAALQSHAEKGQWMLYLSIGLLLVALILALLHVIDTRSHGRHAVFSVAVVLLSVVVGAAVIAGVVQIGHTGAEAVWGGR